MIIQDLPEMQISNEDYQTILAQAEKEKPYDIDDECNIKGTL